MADPELIELLRQGSEVWNKWRQQRGENVYPDLRGANLHSADLNSADLHGADLNSANLSGANLSSTRLSTASLEEANLSRATLERANIRYSTLKGANLNGTNLCRADLNGARLGEADMTGAKLGFTTLAHLDLRTTRGLATITHEGSSPIDLYSVQLPQDGSALHFLRGCGVPDEWIDFYRSTKMSPIQYHSCFISYSNKDDTLSRHLHSDLQAKGVRCWFALHDMKIGDKIRFRIDEAIHLQDKLLLLLSEHSIHSAWVEDEVETALEKERCQGREVLFPIRLDDAVMYTNQAWAAKLRRTRHIGDFTHWTDPQAYEQSFDLLLRDLKKQE